MVYNCVKNNLYEYFVLLCKYRKKDIGIVNGINKCDSFETGGFTPLTQLLISDHCNQEWLSLLLSFKNIDVNQRCQNKNEIYFGKHALDLVNDEKLKEILVNRL